MTATRQSNRNAFPATAAIVDHFRGVFGNDVKVTFAQEGDASVGKSSDEGGYTVISGDDLMVRKVKRDGRT